MQTEVTAHDPSVLHELGEIRLAMLIGIAKQIPWAD